MAEPVRAVQAAPRLTLSLDDVDFAAGQLWRARYPTLIRHEVHDAADLQFEPAFRVHSAEPDQEVEVVFRLARLADEDVEFATGPDGAVDWQLLVPANAWPAPDVTVTLSAGSQRKECRVLWRRSGAPLTALLIRCRHVHGGPQPGSDAWAWTQVEGGVYLALIDRGDIPPAPPEAAQTPAGSPLAGTVRVLGIDEHGRPVYDLFREDFSVPVGLALEPAFRAAPGERPELRLRLDLPPIFKDVRFQVDDAGEIEMAFAVPATRPAHFVGSPGEDLACTLLWSRVPLGQETEDSSRQGRTANLYAMLDLGALRGALGEAIEKGVDPTVIEPPACDASGVCSPPRRGEDTD
jgi:hypothetical protein